MHNDDDVPYPILCGRPSLRRAMRLWMAQCTEEHRECPNFVSLTLGLLDRIVTLFTEYRGSLPTEDVRQHVRQRYPTLYHETVSCHGDWDRFIANTAPILKLGGCGCRHSPRHARRRR